MERHPLRIPGVPPGKGEVESVSAPYGGEVVGEVEQADEAALARALELQSGLLRKRATLPAHERIAVLRRTAGLMRGRSEDLALRIAREGGKPLRDAHSRGPLIAPAVRQGDDAGHQVLVEHDLQVDLSVLIEHTHLLAVAESARARV